MSNADVTNRLIGVFIIPGETLGAQPGALIHQNETGLIIFDITVLTIVKATTRSPLASRRCSGPWIKLFFNAVIESVALCPSV
ncbi:hypothetical protein GJAV_G00033760, partial [Gymnothorax javanicus]